MTRLAVCAVALLLAGPALATELPEIVAREADALRPTLVEARRWFHQHPELGFEEHETSKEVARRLEQIGLEVRTGVAGTGVVAILRGGLAGPVVAYRSDMDALPVSEALEVPYRSQNEGVMHACGHDLHMAVALGVAELLAKHRDQLSGTVKFIFQPSEEKAPPGEPGGAASMIAAGALDDPRPQAIFGLHAMPTLRAGEIGYRSGGIMAAADRFKITVHGAQTHGAAPHQGIDPIWVAAQLITALQGVVSREQDAKRPLVVSVGQVHAGTAFNIIPEQAILEGTVRTADPETYKRIPPAFERVVNGTCAAHRATCTLEYERPVPVLVSDPELTAAVVPFLEQALGPDKVRPHEALMVAEDFAYYAQEIPGFFCFLGVGNPEQGITSYLHSPTFQVDEDALVAGARAMAAAVAGYLETQAIAP